jgi:hypothetical protein
MPKLRCIRYTDAKSAKGSSYKDLLIGVGHSVVGCSSKNFEKATGPGDYVIIVANDGRRKYFMAGRLVERLYECHLWADEGGHVWEHNFTYTPLLAAPQEITPAIKRKVAELCSARLVDPTHLFHGRFCGEKYVPVLLDLVEFIVASPS